MFCVIKCGLASKPLNLGAIPLKLVYITLIGRKQNEGTYFFHGRNIQGVNGIDNTVR